ncbi:MAG: filamentous hemagglutinin N-terminal domain-containing protein [Gammaproteobacteria bacterium]|nr:filamentous hemagglutinin N-terminal domain-containing protein [Gammaproteobacteria bacterium]
MAAPRLRPLTAHMIRRGLLASGLAGHLVFAPLAKAGPDGGEVVTGEGSVSKPSATETHIDQQSQNLLMRFDSFDVDADESVLITQPNATAWFVGEIDGGRPTSIFGSITANGQIALVNPHGVIFGETASISAAGIFASGLSLEANDIFEGGEAEFKAKSGPGGYVVNHGVIAASMGGSVNLLGETVTNSGVIVASLGHVNLSSGSRAVVSFGPEQLIGIELTEKVLENTEGLESAISNTGRIEAPGGKIMLTSSVSKGLFDNAINNEGIVRAKSAEYQRWCDPSEGLRFQRSQHRASRRLGG